MSVTEDQILQGLLDSMQDLEDATANAKVLIYGESGVGKTVAAVQIAQEITPADKRILYLDAVEGWVSLLNHKGLTQRTTRMVYLGRSQIDSIVDQIKEGNEKFTQFGTIILDELSTMSKNDLDRVLAARSAKDKGKDPDVPTQPDFFSNTERMRRTSVGLLKLPVNIILVSHLREDKDQRTGAVFTRPAFMPKFSETLRENVHVVAYMTADERLDEESSSVQYKRHLQVHPTKVIVAKSRVGGLATQVTVPEFYTGLSEWMKGEREDQDESKVIVEDDPIEAVLSDDDESVGIIVE